MDQEKFDNAVQAMKSQDYLAAERLFSKIHEDLDTSAEQYNLLASWLGLARVLNGDEEGKLLCRDAAGHEINNGVVFLNLAAAEWVSENRKRTIDAIRRGKKVDADNERLKHACELFDCRKRCCFNFLPRGHWFNRLVGRLRRRPAEPISVHQLLFGK